MNQPQPSSVGGDHIERDQIIYGDKVGGDKIIYQTTAPVITTPFNLPADLPDFTGRDKEIGQVRQQLSQEAVVTITGIHGMGGIGKTALALHVAHQLAAQGRFSDAQLYIDLKGTDPEPLDPAAALTSLLTALTGPDPQRPADLDALTALWRAAIHNKDALLLFDNAASAAQVRPLLPGCPTCAVLVTSRQRFTLPGAGLLDLHRMLPDDARALLKELAPRLDDAGAGQIAKLCGCLPLALRIAGNYLALNDDQTLEAYAGLLDSERDRLSHLRAPDDPDLDVEAAIALSVAQLDEETRRAWALLALFPAPFDAPAAAALWGTGTDEGQPLDPEPTQARLQVLRNRSLLSYAQDTNRYHQHDLLRLAAAREPEPVKDRDAARERLARHYLSVARAVRDSQRYLDLDPDWPHLRAALAHAGREEAPEVGLLSDLVYALADYFDARGMARDKVAWSRRAYEACAAASRRRDEAAHLVHLGIAYYILGDARQAIDYYKQALDIQRDIGERRHEGDTLGNLGLAYADLGETRQAIEYHEAALAISKEIGDRGGEGNRLGNLGGAYAALGETRQAIEYYEAALAIAKEIGDRRGEGNHLGNLGNAYADLGETRQAIEYHEAALAIAQEIGDRRGEGNHLGNLGSAYAALGETRQAVEYHEAALVISKEIGDRRGEGADLGNLGLAYAALGEPDRARDLWTQALEIFEAIEDPNADRVRGWLAELDES
jgi:tetratricopeptide (TPR) repeat protein